MQMPIGIAPVGQVEANSVALRRDGALRLVAAILVAASLGGCGSMSEKMSQTMSTMPVVGLPANAPERPAEKLAYPAVHDMPPQRTTAVLTADEQRMVEQELVSARSEQQTVAKPKPAAKPAAQPAAKPVARPPVAARARPAAADEPAAAAIPAPRSSSQMIY